MKSAWTPLLTIAQSEDMLGLALVRRDHRPLTLTREGALLAEYAAQKADLQDVLQRRLQVIRKQGAGLVRIASTGASSSTRILPPLLGRAMRVLLETEFEIVELADRDAQRALKEGLVDFATVVGATDEALDYLPVAKDRLVCLLPQSHRLASKMSVTQADLVDEDFIMTKGGSEPLVRDWFRLAGLSPNVRHTALQLTSILAMVQANFGVSVVAEMAVPESHPQVLTLPLSPEKQRDVYLCRTDGSFASHAAERLWTVLGRGAATE